MNILTVSDARKRYGSVQALDGASFELRKGELLALLGPMLWSTFRQQLKPLDALEKRVARVDADSLDGVSTLAEASPRPFSAYVTQESSLRQALDSIVTSRTNVAVVATEGQHYRGILTLERITQEVLA